MGEAHRSRRRSEWMLTLPSFLWLVVLFLLPALVVVAIACKPADPFGGFGAGWTLDTLGGLGNPHYPVIVARTIWYSFLTTLFCLLLATPMAYQMARTAVRWRGVLLLAVIVPFWTSFLVRIFAWKALLHPEGPLKWILVHLGLATPEAQLLYGPGAILLVLVYTELPFAILPIYAAAEKFDFRLVEAARDLGARPFRAFRKVFLPGIRRGVLTAVLVVFIPALGSYIIPDLVGGPGSEMLGNKIAQRVFTDRNLPHAAALSAVLVLAVLAPLVAVLALQRKNKKSDIVMGEAP